MSVSGKFTSLHCLQSQENQLTHYRSTYADLFGALKGVLRLCLGPNARAITLVGQPSISRFSTDNLALHDADFFLGKGKLPTNTCTQPKGNGTWYQLQTTIPVCVAGVVEEMYRAYEIAHYRTCVIRSSSAICGAANACDLRTCALRQLHLRS